MLVVVSGCFTHGDAGVFFFCDGGGVWGGVVTRGYCSVDFGGSSSFVVLVPDLLTFSGFTNPVLSPTEVGLILRRVLPAFLPPYFSVESLCSSLR